MTNVEAQELVDEIAKRLHILGATADEVAKNLLANECFGTRNSCQSCPIAVFIDKAGFDDPRLVVAGWKLEFHDNTVIIASAVLPTAVWHFIKRFDGNVDLEFGGYPALTVGKV